MNVVALSKRISGEKGCKGIVETTIKAALSFDPALAPPCLTTAPGETSLPTSETNTRKADRGAASQIKASWRSLGKLELVTTLPKTFGG
jgi:hypothetical protein